MQKDKHMLNPDTRLLMLALVMVIISSLTQILVVVAHACHYLLVQKIVSA